MGLSEANLLDHEEIIKKLKERRRKTER